MHRIEALGLLLGKVHHARSDHFNPAFSNRLNTSPMRLRPTPSGLMMKECARWA